jgi:hypothetical protein
MGARYRGTGSPGSPFSQRKLMEPSPHRPEAIERARIAVAEARAAGRRKAARLGAANRQSRRLPTDT